MGLADKCHLKIPFPSWAKDKEDPSRDFENWKELQRWADDFYKDCLPSSGGFPWVLVAASDAPTWWADRADYTCDGTADDVQIQAALDTTGTSWVLLSPGFFTVSNTIVVGGGDRLKGAHRQDAWISGPDSTVLVNLSTDARLESVGISYTGTGSGVVGVSVGNDAQVIDCYPFEVAVGVRLAGNRGIVAGCLFQSATGQVGIDDTFGLDCRVRDCEFIGAAGAAFDLAGHRHHITGNVVSSWAAANIDGDHCLLTNNRFENGHGGLTIGSGAAYGAVDSNWMNGGASDVTDSSTTTQYGTNFSAAGTW